MTYIASYKTEVKNENNFETKFQESKNFYHIGNCISWLNEKFNYSYENFYNRKDVFFIWAISNCENVYSGILEVSNLNFIEKVLEVNLNKFKK